MHGTTVIYTKLDEENFKKNELRRDFKIVLIGFLRNGCQLV